MSGPQCCPFCSSHDIRVLTGSGVDLVGYRCHDCQHAFYVAPLPPKPRAADSPQPPFATPRRDVRRERK